MRNTRRAILLLLVAAVAGLLLVPRLWPPRAEYTIQGIAPEGLPATVDDLNNKGDLLGELQWAKANRDRFVWHPDGSVDWLPVGPRVLAAKAINNRGDVAGVEADGGSARTRGFLWRKGQMRWLQRPGTWLMPADVNDAGQVTGIAGSRAFLWEEGRLPLLNDESGHAAGGDGSAVNGRGAVAGSLLRPGAASEPCVWTNGRARLLPVPAGMVQVIPKDINDSGSVIAYAMPAAGGARALLWSDGRWTDLGTLGGRTWPIALNARGTVVGQSGGRRRLALDSRAWPAFWRAFHLERLDEPFVWRDGKMQALNDLIPRDSGWTLETAAGINDNGQIVVNGYHNHERAACVLTPVPAHSR